MKTSNFLRYIQILLLQHISTIYSQGQPAPPPIATIGSEFKGPGGWLRICQPGAGKYIGVVSASSTECPSGYWFKEPLKVGCVCGHGVWVFAKGWCDHTARVIVARKGSCFNINKDVKYIRFLGWGHTAFTPYHFVASSGMEYIQVVPEALTMSSMATHFHKDYNQHIGAIYRKRGVESMTGRVCLSQEGNASRPLAFKYFVPKLPYMQKKGCFAYPGQDLGKFEYDAGYNLEEGLTLNDAPISIFVKPKSWATPADNKKCATECASPKALNITGPKNNSLLPDYFDPIFDDYFLSELKAMNWSNDTDLPEEMPPQVCNEVRQYSLTNKTLLEIKEQTKRMVQASLMNALQDAPAPTVNFSDYNLMQKARKILAKVCPTEELPTAVLTGLHRMFRVALNESFFHYPFNQLGDDLETEKIASALETCYQNAKPMEFVYSSPPNTTGGADPAAKCENGKFKGVHYQFNPTLNRTIMSKLPCYLWSNITDLDLAIETAWKTVMFSHYYCARHFGNDSVVFSVFEQKMERFFNRWIQHRWFYPGPALNAYKYIFQMFDLVKFAKSLDRCVSAARAFSIYRKWIKRPMYTKHIGGRMFEEQYDIPDEIASRTSLDAINPQLTQFSKKAYCLPYWHAPVSNPGINYDPTSDYKAGCIKYRKEEWKNPYAPILGTPNGWRDNINIV